LQNWLNEKIAIFAEETRKEIPGIIPSKFDELIPKQETFTLFPEQRLALGKVLFHQGAVAIPVVWLARYAKLDTDDARIHFSVVSQFREAIDENKLEPMGYRHVNGKGMAFCSAFLNDFRTDAVNAGRVLRYKHYGPTKSFKICSNCDAYKGLNTPLTTTVRGRCDNPDFLNKIVQTSIYPAWDTKACGYFDLIDPEDSVKIDFEQLERKMVLFQAELVKIFFDKKKRKEQ